MLKDVFLIPVGNTYFVCRHPIFSALNSVCIFWETKQALQSSLMCQEIRAVALGSFLSAGCVCTEAYGSGAGVVSALLRRQISFTSAAQVPSLVSRCHPCSVCKPLLGAVPLGAAALSWPWLSSVTSCWWLWQDGGSECCNQGRRSLWAVGLISAAAGGSAVLCWGRLERRASACANAALQNGGKEAQL